MTGATKRSHRVRVRRVAPVAIAAVLFGTLVVGALVWGRVSATSAASSSATVQCKNATTDSATLQAAIDASAPGDEIVFAGKCLLTRTVVLRGKRAYRGESVATTLTRAPSSTMAAMLASDSWATNSPATGDPISLRDLTIDGNKKSNDSKGGDGVLIRSWSTQLENLHIQNTAGDGIAIVGTSRSGVPISGEHTQVQGTIRDCDVVGAGGDGIRVEDTDNAVTDWNLLDSWVGNSAGSGIRMDNAAGWRVSGNHLYDNGESGIWADRLFSTSIDDNLIEDFGADQNAIKVTVQDGSASTISRNRMFQANTDGGTTFVAVTAVASGTGVLGVSDNVIHGNGAGIGLSYTDQPGTLDVTSSGNNLTGVATPISGVAPVRDY